MLHPLTIIFLFLAGIFALVHRVAVNLYLYWYYWWFDIPMHFFGGILIALGVHAFSTFRRINYQPRLLIVLTALAVTTLTWEVFEYFVGLWEQTNYVQEAIKDIAVGFGGGLLAHFWLAKYTIRS